MARILLLISSSSYRAEAFLQAAARLALDVTVGSDHHQVLAAFTSGRTLQLDFRQPQSSLRAIVEHCEVYASVAVIGTDDDTTELASQASAALGLSDNRERAVHDALDKFEFRRVMAGAGLNGPSFQLVKLTTDTHHLATTLAYPCVLKPVNLSGSRGVVRANNEADFIEAFARVGQIIMSTARVARRDVLLIESFIEGCEVSLEGLLEDGRLRVLTLFDKPEPLDGPYFEETLYVTPSRLSNIEQDEITAQTQAATRALGLTTGPIHAEVRLNSRGAFVIELAPRTIGGLCSRAVRFSSDVSLEEVVLRQAVGITTPTATVGSASGVMMIPIPAKGVLREICGLDEALNTPGVSDVRISVPLGDIIVPLPEGDRYLGFIFADANTPASVETALRSAHEKLRFDLH